MTQYQKVHSPAKKITTQDQNLQEIVLKTMSTIANAVGSTLGPGGRQVLIEQQELGLPNLITKDGVTVFKSLGFKDPTQHVIMEAARDAAARTATEAGDGTTTATILADAIVQRMVSYCRDNPHVSPQKVIRTLKSTFKTVIEPAVKKLAIKANSSTRQGRRLLHNVAMVSANGDEALADAVLECFDIVGDEGNVTLSELAGPSEYQVEHIEGYPIPTGFDDSCQKFYDLFLNDRVNQRVYLEKPVFVLYHGVINDVMTLGGVTGMVWQAWQESAFSPNVVVAATGFSEQVRGVLAGNFQNKASLNIVPLVVPLSPIPNGQKHLLEDLSAITGATIFDPIDNPLPPPNVILKSAQVSDGFDLDHLGHNVESFEMLRTKSTIVGRCDEDLVLERAEDLKTQARSAESILDKAIIEERIGKLTGGIAKLIVVGSSAGEIREGKDRAEDAVRAVQGTVKHGCLPGGAWTLLKLAQVLRDMVTNQGYDAVNEVILAGALEQPFFRLLENVGLTREEQSDVYGKVSHNAFWVKSQNAIIYDALTGEYVNAVKAGLLDSTSAVLEAIRNSLSIASLLGTLGACVTFYRDQELEREEARATSDFLRNSSVNEADERA